MSHQVAVAELTEAREKLRAAEGELATAKAALDAVKDGDDAQQIVKAELDVAEAKLGVAKAELGVAEAKWQAATEGDKAVLQESVTTAQESVKTAQKAYNVVLDAAAPPHGGVAAGLAEQLGQLALQVGAVQGSLATIHETQALIPLIQDSVGAVQDSVGAVKDDVATMKTTVDSWREPCNMSAASSTKHGHNFVFDVSEDNPPMVDESDSRIASLVQHLLTCRKKSGFNKSDEAACRSNAVDVFFRAVATALEGDIVSSNDTKCSLTVRLARTEFSGHTDLLIGHTDTFPLLSVEVKPMTGRHHLKGGGFSSEVFSHKTQIVLQCAALQAQCSGSPTLYSCLLTNLLSLYVVQVTSFDARTISSRTFKVVQDPEEFVRAVLRAADANAGLTAGASVGSLVCEAAQGFNSNRPDPAAAGLQQFPQSSSASAYQLLGGAAESGGVDGGVSRTVVDWAAWNFERLLPTQRQQKSDVRPNLTRAWVRLAAREHLQDLDSTANVGAQTVVWD